MANWYGSARSNYFAVKDEKAFREWAAEFNMEVIEKDGLFGLLPGDTEDGNWPAIYDNDVDEPRHVEDELQAHLADGAVAVLKTIGSEKLQYLTAYAIVLTPTESHYYDLDEVVLANHATATKCEY